MDDSDGSLSSAPSASQQLDAIDPLPSTNEVIIDLTGDQDDSSTDAASPAVLVADKPPVIKPRPYQTEMVEESLRTNIIVAMDTGSGKTHIAVLRMLHELERLPPHQIIWFLAPTVALCEQQFDVIESQISSVQVKFLSGADGVDRWTERSLWDAVLKNVKIVVSPYQILLDALSHAFVRMDSLGLIIFDEAHNCVGKYPGSKLMQNFYHKRKAQGLSVPHILGLTASPVMRSNPQSLTSIEDTLDAICRTPKKHRAELRLQVKLPVLEQVYYEDHLLENQPRTSTRTIESLSRVYKSLKLREDPFVISLIRDDSDRSRRRLEKVYLNQKTYCRDQIKSFYMTAVKICKDLGDWAADYYVSEVVAKVLKLSDEPDTNLGIWDIARAEKQYVAKTLKQVEVTPTHYKHSANILMISDKVNKLIDVLLREESSFRGVIFVQERAAVSVLAYLLSIHPETRDRFKIATMVGTSAHSYRAHNIGELVDLDSQKDTLSLFRSGKINLIIATSVLEEGIDVPACNIVICFQKPANLKSFVQRRGRARQRDSKLILLLDSSENKNKLEEFEKLEEVMKQFYEDEMRTLQETLVVEDAEESDGETFQVENTGAMLDMDNAMAHLYHFCATLPPAEYVDLRPEFICNKVGGGLIRAQVLLPLSVPQTVRTSESRRIWKSERNAIKDAAFQAYIALYKAGLVSENMLPLLRHRQVTDELTATAIETRASIVSVDEQLNPWVDVAKAWRDTSSKIFKSTIMLDDLQWEMYLPIQVPQLLAYPLYWDTKTTLLVKHGNSSILASSNLVSKASEDTWCLLQASFGSRWPIKNKRSVVEFSTTYPTPLKQMLGCHDITDQSQLGQDCGLIRDKLSPDVRYFYKSVLNTKPPIEQVQDPYSDYHNTPNSPHISVNRHPRRLDFLHKIPAGNEEPTTKPYSAVLPLSRCTVDELPWKFVRFGLMIPSILRRLEVYLTAQTLSDTLLKDVRISDLNLTITAISAGTANEAVNYQRQEFLGDSILKMCTSVQLMAEFPLWHEGYLSKMKDRLVANSRLSRAAVDIGLDKFILTKSFNGRKWRPLYIDDLLAAPTTRKRDMSTKVLADVVEALIGASVVDGGIPKALTCLQVFLPEIQWQPLESRRSFLYQRAPDVNLPSTLEPLQALLGYKFKKPSLLIEAMTHASCNTGSGSLERLEFLGDSLLDYIIVTALWKEVPELPHFTMHLLRTVLVNADYLAFVSMSWSISQEIIDVDSETLQDKKRSVEMPLYRFMRHTSPELASVQKATATRFSQLRPEIKSALENGTHYPWHLLCKLQARKCYSDVVESLIGAVWIDSGSCEVCTDIVERMGILEYLRRILRDGVHIWHPKEELGVLADNESVRYVIEKQSKAGDAKEREEFVGVNEILNGGWGYKCTVFVGDREVAKVYGGETTLEVGTKAAERAVQILTAEKNLRKRSRKMEIDVPGTSDVEMEDGFWVG